MRVTRQLFHFVDVAPDRIGEVREIQREQFCICQPQYCGSGELGQRPAIDEIRVGEMRVPIEIVIDGVINTAFVFAAETQVDACNAEMIQERRVIRARSQCANAQELPLGAEPPAYWRTAKWGDFSRGQVLSAKTRSRSPGVTGFVKCRSKPAARARSRSSGWP